MIFQDAPKLREIFELFNLFAAIFLYWLARVPKKTKLEKETIKERKSDDVIEKEPKVGANEKVVA